MPPLAADCTRRTALARAAFLLFASSSAVAAEPLVQQPDPKWYEAAVSMKRLAESWGDEPYGAVLLLAGSLVGEGPSRVVKNRDADAHAEREAIRDAQLRLGRNDLSGAVLYSTSRPCALCMAAAARAGVARMYHGPSLLDAGEPRGEAR